jgi:hypothetical protein
MQLKGRDVPVECLSIVCDEQEGKEDNIFLMDGSLSLIKSDLNLRHPVV